VLAYGLSTLNDSEQAWRFSLDSPYKLFLLNRLGHTLLSLHLRQRRFRLGQPERHVYSAEVALVAPFRHCQAHLSGVAARGRRL
jgi:hypothetical protein